MKETSPNYSSTTQPTSLVSDHNDVESPAANHPKPNEANQPLPLSAAPSLFPTVLPDGALTESAGASVATSASNDNAGSSTNTSFGTGDKGDLDEEDIAIQWGHLWRRAQSLGTLVFKGVFFACVFAVVILVVLECLDQGSYGSSGGYFGGELMRPSRILSTSQQATRGGSYELVAQVQEDEEEDGQDSELAD